MFSLFFDNIVGLKKHDPIERFTENVFIWTKYRNYGKTIRVTSNQRIRCLHWSDAVIKSGYQSKLIFGQFTISKTRCICNFQLHTVNKFQMVKGIKTMHISLKCKNNWLVCEIRLI